MAKTKGNRAINGTEGADSLSGTTGNDIIYGLGGNDSISGLDGSDFIAAGAGDDLLDGGLGYDHLDGGAGNDTFVVDNALDTVIEGVDGGTDRVLSSVNYMLHLELEHLTLTGTAVSGTGNYRNNEIVGNASDNILDGREGNDVLNGGAGIDTMVGGLGNDRFYVNVGDDVVSEAAGQGDDFVLTSASYSLAAGVSVETMTTTNQASTAAINLTGNEFNQALYGNAGVNVLNGGAGNDTLVGLDGNDALIGGAGADSLNGGAGNDTFVFNAASESTVAAPDRIANLNAGDLIDLSAIDANGGQIGDQAFSFIGGNAFTNTAGELRYEQVNGNTLVYGDTNGDGAADFAITVTGTQALTVDYFTL